MDEKFKDQTILMHYWSNPKEKNIVSNEHIAECRLKVQVLTIHVSASPTNSQTIGRSRRSQAISWFATQFFRMHKSNALFAVVHVGLISNSINDILFVRILESAPEHPVIHNEVGTKVYPNS